ncbi:MAG TPA: TetR family transcriptional regulator [Rhizomicrobium sp.]|jgi:AcrR family transcriptional regulator
MGSIALQTDADISPVPEPTGSRSTILAAARRVAERDGILDLSLLTVAREAGVEPGSIYSNFSSKNDLLLAVVADDLAALASAMRGTFDVPLDRKDDTVIAAIAAQTDSREEQVTEKPVVAVDPKPKPVFETEANNAPQPDVQAPASDTSRDAISKLQETVARLESRPVDAWLERRLREFERSLAALEGRHTDRDGAEKTVEERFREIGDSLEILEQKLRGATDEAARSLTQRLDACENRLRGVASDTQADASTLATRITALENAAFAAKPEFFIAPPGPATETGNRAEQQITEPVPEAATVEPIVAGAAPGASFLASARKSAQAAAVVRDTHTRKTVKQKSPTMVYLAMGSLFLFVALLTAAGFLLRNSAMNVKPLHASPDTRTTLHSSTTLLRQVANKNPQFQLRRLAEAGDPRAELLIGLQYMNGTSAPGNDAAAFAWLSRAAAHKQPLAQFELGVMYENGRGVRVDPAQAFRWFESAALKGNRRAMHSLATAYAEGWGTEKNLFESARWYGRAAQLGSVNDQFNLGVLFERGMGVVQSLPDAYKWYSIAASQGDRESQSRIAAIGPMLAPNDLAAAQQAATSFKPDPISATANEPPQLAQTQTPRH